MADDAKDLERFLKNVDDVEAVVRELATTDNPDALAKADKILANTTTKKKHPPRDNTGVNRTVINHAAFKDDEKPIGQSPNITEDMGQKAFMEVLERDAQERTERRKKQRAEATVIKEEANEYFKAGDYETAVELYTKALGVVKDLSAVWTNRAQAYIKLGKYEDALVDCDWAQRLDENCLKAYVHQGRALQLLGKYDEAVSAFQTAMDKHPTKQAAIQAYIDGVQQAREAAKQEAEARSLLAAEDEGATGLVNLLQRLNKEGQPAAFYTGGLHLVSAALQTTTDRALFRTEGGLELVKTHAFISRCWLSEAACLSPEELMVIEALLSVYLSAITDNEENLRRLLPLVAEGLLTWAGANQKEMQGVRGVAVDLLHTVSQSAAGQDVLIETLDLTRFLEVAFKGGKGNDACASNILGILNNLALHKKFRTHVKPQLDTLLLAPLEELLTNISTSKMVKKSVLTTMTNLVTDTAIRRKIAERQTIWQACSSLLEEAVQKETAGDGDSSTKVNKTTVTNTPVEVEMVNDVLGLLMNLSVDIIAAKVTAKSVLSSTGDPICRACTLLLGGKHSTYLELRSVGLLSHLTPLGGSPVETACSAGLVPALVVRLQNENLTMRKAAMKSLTACTMHVPDSVNELLETPKGLSSVVAMLKEKDEVLAGNTALCLSQLTAVSRVVSRLTKTAIVQNLLVWTRDGHRPELQKNCAILLAKLCQADTKHLERLRELHGIEILAHAMKGCEL